MAQKTVIIRPHEESYIHTNSSNPDMVTTPANASLQNVLGESIPDDGSTYLKITDSLGYADLSFIVDKSDWNIIPTGIRAIFRFKYYGSYKSGLELQYNGETIGSYYPNEMNVYETITIDLTDTYLEKMWNFNDENQSITLRIIGSLGSTNSKASIEVYLTQAYLEYDCDDGIVESIYFKQSSAWNALTGKIYQKRNGVWTGHKANKFQEDTKLYVVVLND